MLKRLQVLLEAEPSSSRSRWSSSRHSWHSQKSPSVLNSISWLSRIFQVTGHPSICFLDNTYQFSCDARYRIFLQYAHFIGSRYVLFKHEAVKYSLERGGRGEKTFSNKLKFAFYYFASLWKFILPSVNTSCSGIYLNWNY